MAREQITVTTTDGECPTWVMTPDSGAGPWPGVIMFTDAFAIRPASLAAAERLANEGYVVLLPDIYHRHGPYEPIDPKAAFATGFREAIGHLMGTTNYRKAAEDAAPLIAWLNASPKVAPKSYGVTGYCMGGGIAVSTAGLYPDKIAACAPFHAGGLATDAEISPHLLVPAIKAELYVGVADNDATYPADMADRFTKALDEAGVTYRHELYPGSAHGWTQTDFPVYDEPAAERHWVELLALLKRTIG